jgi:hypothetical protein
MRNVALTVAAAVAVAIAGRVSQAVPPSNVPPTMEIEVLDPGVDPEGNPAVQLGRGEDGQTIVDIPPTVLVHRYYYTGDRTFQAQMLRGGPVIIVVNHPKTGERTYVEAQLPPGAPRVTYKGNSIIYQYQHHAAILHFGLFGKASVTYRNGLTWGQTAARAVHLEQLHEGCRKIAAHAKQSAARCSTPAAGAAVAAGDAAKGVVAPVGRVAVSLPVVRTVFSGDLEERMARKLAEHRRDHQAKAGQKEKDRRDWTIPTNIQ